MEEIRDPITGKVERFNPMNKKRLEQLEVDRLFNGIYHEEDKLYDDSVIEPEDLEEVDHDFHGEYVA